MQVIGITGGIGSGKTTVAKIFACLGIPVLNTDTVAKQLYKTDLQLRQQIIDAFGNDIFVNNILQPKVLAAIAFASEENTALLNSIVHPKVITYSNNWVQQQLHVPYCIKESALLIESGAYINMNAIILVSAPINVRLQRVINRDNTTKEAVMLRIEKQMPEEEKIKLATYTIINDEAKALIPQVLNIHNAIINSTKK
jgi:dephospho-CoA kinase